MGKTKLDEIGYWSEIKLDIIKKYAVAYTKILNKQPHINSYHYIVRTNTHIILNIVKRDTEFEQLIDKEK